MITPKKVHCFFEQSGTFKNEFQKLGIDAEDYDILNDFGQTDNIIDLFAEIDKAYGGGKSLFDKISSDDLIIAFFPCIRFEDQIKLGFRGELYQQSNWDDVRKIEYNIKLHKELSNLYLLVCKLFVVAIQRNLRMIVENPYSVQHYLTNYFCLKPAIIDKDRRENGDYYKKPTQYWFLNCEPENNVVFEPMEITESFTCGFVTSNNKFNVGRKVLRSMIHPQYARRFILSFILKGITE